MEFLLSQNGFFFNFFMLWIFEIILIEILRIFYIKNPI